MNICHNSGLLFFGPLRSIIGKTIITTTFFVFSLIFLTICHAESDVTSKLLAADQQSEEQVQETVEMLSSLIELQHSLKEQISLSRKKYNNSKSDAEKTALEQELTQLDQQLSGTANDFERIATGVEPALFAEKKPETFSWKDELTSLVEPAIKELKRFTIRARQKTRLKDTIAELEKLVITARDAVEHLQTVLEENPNKQVHKEVKALLPEWMNVEKRLLNKLELAELELSQLEEQDVSLVESSRNSIRTFFRDRGLYLIIAVITFVAILLVCRILYRLIFAILARFHKDGEQRSFQVRLFDILFKGSSVILAVIGLFFVLYLAEDWFLLSMAIMFFLGIVWTIRQGLPRLWQQGRLMLNIGSVRENERLMLHGVPWRVGSINVFCQLENPALGVKLRIPVEVLVGLVSRPCKQEEPWFPCKKGDWVVVGNESRARVTSLSHEQVELVERGGKRRIYPTEVFLQACPVNLSRNFRLRVPFGISYSLQEKATSTIPVTLKEYIQSRMEEEGYQEHCLNLQIEFHQANTSSLDLIVLADFSGQVADICKRIERAIQKWCVECCTKNDWEIPFPQITVHRAEQGTVEA